MARSWHLKFVEQLKECRVWDTFLKSIRDGDSRSSSGDGILEGFEFFQPQDWNWGWVSS